VAAQKKQHATQSDETARANNQDDELEALRSKNKQLEQRSQQESQHRVNLEKRVATLWKEHKSLFTFQMETFQSVPLAASRANPNSFEQMETFQSILSASRANSESNGEQTNRELKTQTRRLTFANAEEEKEALRSRNEQLEQSLQKDAQYREDLEEQAAVLWRELKSLIDSNGDNEMESARRPPFAFGDSELTTEADASRISTKKSTDVDESEADTATVKRTPCNPSAGPSQANQKSPGEEIDQLETFQSVPPESRAALDNHAEQREAFQPIPETEAFQPMPEMDYHIGEGARFGLYSVLNLDSVFLPPFAFGASDVTAGAYASSMSRKRSIDTEESELGEARAKRTQYDKSAEAQEEVNEAMRNGKDGSNEDTNEETKEETEEESEEELDLLQQKLAEHAYWLKKAGERKIEKARIQQENREKREKKRKETTEANSKEKVANAKEREARAKEAMAKGKNGKKKGTKRKSR